MTLIPPPDASPQPFFADQLASRGAAPALVTAGRVLSYGELDTWIEEVVGRLGDVPRLMLLPTANTIESVVAYLAALRGRHPVLLASADDQAVAALVDLYQPGVIATSDGELIERPFGSRPFHPALAVLLSTSGSTGSPKLVRLSPENLDANAAAIAQYLAIGPIDRAITSLPMHYCYGLSVINSHLHGGGSIVLSELSVVDPCFWDLFRRSGATSLAGVPHTFDLLDRVGFDTLKRPSLRYVTQAGGRMPPETVRRYTQLGDQQGWELFVMYGQTETTARMAYLPPALAAVHPSAIGIPIAGGAFRIDAPDEHGIGELVYRGANVMLGYATGPEDFVLGRVVDELRTGDLARQHDGLYKIVGRCSRFIKPFGVRVDLDDLERLLAVHGVHSMCTGDDHQLVVAVDSADPAAVAAILDERLPLPASRILVLPLVELPRLPTGKADYAAIHREACRRRDQGDQKAPSTRTTAVSALFTEILAVEPREDDSFVTLGGDSLSYVEMSVRLEELIGTLPGDWHTRPIRDLPPATVRRPRRWAPIDTTVVVRAVAIVLVVGTHTRLWHHPGGAHALLAVAGYNFARFQLGVSSMVASVTRIALPSMCWIGMVAASADDFTWAHVLFLNGQLGGPDARWAYWFVEALVQILVPLAVVFAVPAVGRLEQRRPFLVAALAVAVGLVVRFDLVDLSSDHRIYRPQEVFWLFALGWAAARAATGRQRGLVLLVATVTVAGFFGDARRELIVGGVVAIIAWLPTIVVPRSAVRATASVAGASLYIYLTHFQVYPPVNRALGPAVAAAVSIAAGIATWEFARRGYRRVADSQIIPALGSRRITKITAEQPDRFYPALAKKGYSASVIKQTHVVLRRVYDTAVRWRWVGYNPRL